MHVVAKFRSLLICCTEATISYLEALISRGCPGLVSLLLPLAQAGVLRGLDWCHENAYIFVSRFVRHPQVCLIHLTYLGLKLMHNHVCCSIVTQGNSSQAAPPTATCSCTDFPTPYWPCADQVYPYLPHCSYLQIFSKRSQNRQWQGEQAKSFWSASQIFQECRSNLQILKCK